MRVRVRGEAVLTVVASTSVAAAVFDTPHASRARTWFAGALAAAVYGGVVAWAVLAPPARASRAAPRPPEMVVELFVPPPPPPAAPPTPEPPPPSPPRPAATVAAAPRPTSPPEPPAAAPAQSAEVLAQEAPADEPLDLTAFSITTGAGDRYAGGATSSAGTSTRAVTGPARTDGIADGTGSAPAVDLSRPVRAREDEWDCPWPPEADALGIDEQIVVVRVVVEPDGEVESAELVSDPGHGFGREVLGCARRKRFEAARDRAGRPVHARSAPIRVRFTR